jgi:predicted transcriptional regulator
MKRAVIEIRRDDDAKAILEAMGKDFVSAWNGEKTSDPVATFSFSSPAQLFSVISPKRWELIERLQKIGPESVRGLARSLGRDVKRVHDDVTSLIDWGIIERTEQGKVCVPYDVIHAGFDLKAVA